jgi:hypothetical protein
MLAEPPRLSSGLIINRISIGFYIKPQFSFFYSTQMLSPAVQLLFGQQSKQPMETDKNKDEPEKETQGMRIGHRGFHMSVCCK